MYADHLLLPWVEALPDVDFFDAHTHTGANDPDGYRDHGGGAARGARDRRRARRRVHDARARRLRRGERPRHRRGGGRRTGSSSRSAASTRTRIAVAEAERCLARGARGIKLHPRAERFTLDHPEVERLFALADERRLPILVHAGRGIPALGRHAYELTGQPPERAADPGPRRRLGPRLALAPRGRAAEPALRHLVVDVGRLPRAVLARAAGADPDRRATPRTAHRRVGADARHRDARSRPGSTATQLECVAARQTERLVAGDDLIDAGPAPGPPAQPPDLLLERIHSYLVTAVVAHAHRPAAATSTSGSRDSRARSATTRRRRPWPRRSQRMLDRLRALRGGGRTHANDGCRGRRCRSRSRRQSSRARPTCRCPRSGERRRRARGGRGLSLRAEFPVFERAAFLNAGSDGPTPRRAVDAVRDEIERQAAEGRHAEYFARRSSLVDRQRAAYAALLGCPPEELALTTCTTEGIATVAAGFGRGDTILTSDEEHPGVYGPLGQARRRGAEIVVAPFDQPRRRRRRLDHGCRLLARQLGDRRASRRRSWRRSARP